jgi:hypothetical protein
MPTNDANRFLSTAYTRAILLAVHEVLGRNGLNATLNIAGLQRFMGTQPLTSPQGSAMRASDLATLLQSIEAQYGSGARGQLNRIGHDCFKQIVVLDAWNWNALSLTNRVLPARQRIGRALEQLARALRDPDGEIEVSSDGERWQLIDNTSDGTYGRTRATEICWLTVGQIQECVYWANGQNYEVTEVTCTAKGDPACTFIIEGRTN